MDFNCAVLRLQEDSGWFFRWRDMETYTNMRLTGAEMAKCSQNNNLDFEEGLVACLMFKVFFLTLEMIQRDAPQMT